MIPLAEELRPKTIEEIVGQEEAVGEGSLIQRTLRAKKPLSLLLYGPPGTGKTSLAELYAKAFGMRFQKLSAIFSGTGDLKKILNEEEKNPLFRKGLFLFVDEIHRFNKAQQDAFLPFLENGALTLVGATTENPSFYLNSALLSRLRVVTLKPLSEKALQMLISRYETVKNKAPLPLEIKKLLIERSQGDGRYLFNLLENLATLEEPTLESAEKLLIKRQNHYDKSGDQHYGLISALHKSVRGSDPDAALYWFQRMLEGGESPLFLARRLIRMAVEDIGLADPEALKLAVAAKDAFEMLGSPEGELALAEVVVYLALAPKSNSLYLAFKKAKKSAEASSHLSPPKIILNGATSWMKREGYGEGYLYDHDLPSGVSGQNYFPEEMQRERYYTPKERGFEREMKKRIDYFDSFR